MVTATIVKYLPWVLVLLAFFGGMLLKGNNDKELRKQFEKEKKQLQESIKVRDARIQTLTALQLEIRYRMTKDSLKNTVILKGKEIEINKLKKSIHAVNFSNSTTRQLDSIRASLLQSR